MPREDGRGLPHLQEALFAVMGRNAARISDFLKLPNDHVVEIGRQIEIDKKQPATHARGLLPIQ